MNKVLTSTEAAIRKLSILLIGIVGLCIIVMMLNVVADVVGKYVFNRPVYGTSELVGNYYMIAIVFLSIPLVELYNKQIYVDLFYRMFGTRMRHASLLLVFIFQAIFHAVLGYESFNSAIEATQKREIVEGFMAMSIWPSRYLLVIGFAIGFVIAVLRFIQVLTHHPALNGYLTVDDNVNIEEI